MSIKIENILELLKTINSTIDFDSIFQIIINSIRDFLNVERCSLFLVDIDENILWSKIAHDLEIEKIIIPLDKGLVGTCAKTGEIIIVNNAYEDERFCQDVDKKTGFTTKTVLCYPLKNLEEQIVGVLQLINKNNAPFSEEDIELLNILSQHLVIALNNSIYFKETLEKRELDIELSIAKEIQEKFLPHSIPEIDFLELACKNLQCDYIGGDYYDVFKIDKDKTFIVIADVSGHGIPSALLMANIQAAFHMQDYHKLPLSHVFELLNDFVCQTVEMEKYITAFAGIFDSTDKSLTYVNAGHLPPFILRDNTFIELEATGIPIGMFPKQVFSTKTFFLNSGDILVLYTDGITESFNYKGEMFSIERLKELISKNRNYSPNKIMEKIISETDQFSYTQNDDITLLIGKID